MNPPDLLILFYLLAPYPFPIPLQILDLLGGLLHIISWVHRYLLDGGFLVFGERLLLLLFERGGPTLFWCLLC